MRESILFCVWIFTGALAAQVSDLGAFDFHRADSVAARYQGMNLHHLPMLADHLTADLPTEVEQFRAIYTWVCSNITADHDAVDRNFRKRQRLRNDSLGLALWNRQFSRQVFQKLVQTQQTVCTGYAYLIKELATWAGIRCEVIDGYGRTVMTNIRTATAPNHSWNAVYLNQQWYLCDATWSSGYTILPANVFVADYKDGYFLASPSLFVRNHYPLDTAWILMDQPPTFEEFLHGPLIYKDAFTHHLEPVSPAMMDNIRRKNEGFQIQLQAPDSMRLSDLQLEIRWKGTSWREQADVVLGESGLIEISYQCEKRGLLDVHILYGDDYIATYALEVLKAPK